MANCADALLSALRPMGDGLGQTFGRSCEVVLHDFRDPDRSVVAVAGDVTPDDTPLDQLINSVLAAAQHDPAASLSGLQRSERRELLRPRHPSGLPTRR